MYMVLRLYCSKSNIVLIPYISHCHNYNDQVMKNEYGVYKGVPKFTSCHQ
jgi:hypothetical protein